MQLAGRVMVISGGSSGIGLTAAETWAAEGAAVILLARGAERLRAAANDLRATGAEVHALPADVGNPDDVDRVAAFIEAYSGRVDLLFNNAGVAPPVGPLCDLPTADWFETIQTNLTGPYLLSRALLPFLRVAPGSQILNTTSELKASPGWGAYSVSKSGLDALTLVLAAELLQDGVRVNSFDPGWVRTAMAPDAPASAASLRVSLLTLALTDEDGPTGQRLSAD